MLKARWLFFTVVFAWSVSCLGEDTTEYESKSFKSGGEFSVLVRCLYLGNEFNFADDNYLLFDKIVEHLSDINSQDKPVLLRDARRWLVFYENKLKATASVVAEKYWESNCKEQHKQLHDSFLNTDKI